MSSSTRPVVSRRTAAAPLALGFALALASCAPADTSVWKTFSPEGAKFSVSMPGTPERNRGYGKNESGTLETNVYTYVLPDGGFYTVVDAALPQNFDAKQGTAVALDSACDQVAGSADARLVSKEKVFLGRHEGRQIEAEVPESAVAGGGIMRGRIYLAGSRLYEVVAVVPKAAASSPSIARFLDSFEVKES